MTRITRTIKCDCQRCRHKLDNTFAWLENIPVYRLAFALVVCLTAIYLINENYK